MNEQKIEDGLEKERQDALLAEMGIDATESDKLRGMMLSANEAVAAKSEELMNARQAKGRKKDWEEFVDAKRRMGRVMHHSEFIRKLRVLIPSLIVGPGRVRGQLGLYKSVSMPVKDVPDYKGSEKWYFSLPVYIGWIAEGYMPEYEIDTVNDAKIAIGQKRGWRTILLRLITRWHYEMEVTTSPGVREVTPKCDIWGRPIKADRASIITEEQALEAFGCPTNGLTASTYRHQLYNFRNAVPEPIPDPKSRRY